MFLQVFVILFTGGVCLSACWDMHLHQEQTPPWGADTPQGADTHPRSREPPGAVHVRRYGQQAGGTHPTGMHTCSKKSSMDKSVTSVLNETPINNSPGCSFPRASTKCWSKPIFYYTKLWKRQIKIQCKGLFTSCKSTGKSRNIRE